MKKIAILGATGSVGRSTLDLIAGREDDYEVAAVTAGSNVAALADIARRTRAELAVVADERLLGELRDRLAGSGCRAAAGEAALCEAAVMGQLTVAAIVGFAGLKPVMAALKAFHPVALANKEALVAAGELMMLAAREHGSVIIPIDSEHNAIFQCLEGNFAHDVERLVLTASGGPFRTWSAERMATATPAEAIAHPNWSMGEKISVDSATMMNKGLELIEAAHLFGMRSSAIDILVHPQSVVHSLVQYRDGSMLAQLGPADMRVPISYALAYPGRMAVDVPRLDLADLAQLDFEAPDAERFPALRLARQALEAGGTAPIVLNAANEVAVGHFLAGRIRFTDIAAMVEQALHAAPLAEPRSIEEVIEHDRDARSRVEDAMKRKAT